MKANKRKKGESLQQYIDRIFPHLSTEDREKIVIISKESWFDGLRFERNSNK